MRLILTPESLPSVSFDSNELPITIGRDPEATVVLDSSNVSKLHVRIELKSDEFVVFDLESTNGTEIGERPLRKKEGRSLTDGTTLTVGVPISVRIEPSKPVLVGTTREQALELVRLEAVRRRDLPSLAVVEGASRGARLELDRRDVVFGIGRSEACALVLNDSRVSALHLEVRRVADDIEVRDPGSRHGSWLGHDRLDASWKRWPVGQHLAFGDSVIALVGERRPDAPVSIEEPHAPQSPAGVVAAPPVAVEASEPPKPVGSAAPVVAVPPASSARAPTPPKRAPISPEKAIYIGAIGVIVACLAAFVWIVVSK